MATFTIGEEVLYEDVRYVVAGVRGGTPPRYRLLATLPEGARIVWAAGDEIRKIRAYTEAVDDTARA